MSPCLDFALSFTFLVPLAFLSFSTTLASLVPTVSRKVTFRQLQTAQAHSDFGTGPDHVVLAD